MSAEGLAKIKVLINALSNFYSKVTIGDYKILTAGTDRAVIIRETTNDLPYKDSKAYATLLETCLYNIEVYHKYVNAEESYSDVIADCDTITTELIRHKTLGGLTGIVKSEVLGKDEPMAIFRTDGKGPFFMRRIIKLRTEEIIMLDMVA